MAKFSIILPVRNGGVLAKACVESVLLQTFSNFNFIILDNNSNDDTPEWIQSFNDGRIVLLKSGIDLTMPQNWHRALSLQTNEFVTFIGHDDLLFENYLDEMNKLIEAHPFASLYQTHFKYIDLNGNVVRKCKPMSDIVKVESFLKGEFLQTMDSMGTGYMFRFSDFKKFGGFNIDYPNLIFADYELWVQLAGLSYLAVSPEVCFGYRLHNSLSITTKVEDYRIAFEKYIYFLYEYSIKKAEVGVVIKNYGHKFLYFYCQSLSHRLLKHGSPENRMSVGNFVNECKKYASMLNLKEKFDPNSRWRIWIAVQVDKSRMLRKIFQIIRRTKY